MPNTIITPTIVAKEALMRLKNNLVLGNLVYRGYSEEFAKGTGDTVKIKTPAMFTANEYNGSTIVLQSITEGYTTITLNKLLDVSFAVSSKELTLDISDFGQQYIEGAVQAFAEQIDAYIAALYVDIPYFTKVSATPTEDDIADIDKIMNLNKVPMTGRNLVLDPVTKKKYITKESFLHADKSGTTETLREASLGRVFGFDTYLDQSLKVHTAGVCSGVTATGTLGDTTITCKGAATNNFKKGDLITIASTVGQYVVTQDVTLATGGVSVNIYPALKQSCTDASVTLVDSHIANLAFHTNAFALASATLEPPLDGRKAGVVRDPDTGLAIRVVYGYDMDKKSNIISMDMLVGFKTLMPELAVRFCG